MAYHLAAIPKWALIDRLGAQLSGGKMYTYKADDKSTPKVVYKDSSGQNPYTNPVIFDSVGQQGPFYWDDSENYYIEVYDKNDVLQWTLDNYNSDSGGGGSVNNFFEITNYFLNSNFLYNTPPTIVDDSEIVIADGPWYFKKNNTSASDAITFELFNLGQTDVDKSPTYYFQFSCSSVGSLETEKDLKFRFDGVRTFANQTISLSLDGKSPGPDTIDIRYHQYFGTGGSPSADVGASLATQALTTSWARYEFDNLAIPNISGKSIGDNGDDYLEIIIRMPLDKTATIQLTNLQVELRNAATSYEYETNDVNIYRARGANLPRVIAGTGATDTDNLSVTAQSDGSMAFVGHPPVGTIVDFAAETAPDGWLLCDGSTYTVVGDNAEYVRLYNVIGQRFGKGENAFFMADGEPDEKIIATCTTGQVTIAPNAQTSGFSFDVTHKGEDPIDFDVYNYLGLTPQAWVEFRNQAVGKVTAPTRGNISGASVIVNQEGTPFLREIVTFTFSAASASASLAGRYILISSHAVNYYIWFKVDGIGDDPAISRRMGIQVELASTDTAIQVVQKLVDKIRGRQVAEITAVAASALSGGEFFDIYNGTQGTRVWFTKDGVGTAPAVTSEYLVQVDMLTNDNAAVVASKVKAVLDVIQFQIPDDRGAFIRGWDNSAGIDPDANTRRSANGEYSSDYVGDHVGTYQYDQVISHRHDTSAGGRSEVMAHGGPEKVSYQNSHTGYYGAYETRPYNKTYARIIKY